MHRRRNRGAKPPQQVLRGLFAGRQEIRIIRVIAKQQHPQPRGHDQQRDAQQFLAALFQRLRHFAVK